MKRKKGWWRWGGGEGRRNAEEAMTMMWRRRKGRGRRWRWVKGGRSGGGGKGGGSRRYSNDVIMGAIASQITSLTIVYSTVYSGADQRIQYMKALRHWPLCGEFTGDRRIPRTNGQWRGKCFHLMTSSWGGGGNGDEVEDDNQLWQLRHRSLHIIFGGMMIEHYPVKMDVYIWSNRNCPTQILSHRPLTQVGTHRLRLHDNNMFWCHWLSVSWGKSRGKYSVTTIT